MTELGIIRTRHKSSYPLHLCAFFTYSVIASFNQEKTFVAEEAEVFVISQSEVNAAELSAFRHAMYTSK